MKNITVTVDDETYRRARVYAAERDSSVSALVKQYLGKLGIEPEPVRNLRQEQESLLDELNLRHPRFKAADNLKREQLHSRHAIR